MTATSSRRALLRAGAALPLLAAMRRPAAAAAAPRLRLVGPWEIAGLEPAISGYFFTRLQVCETLVESDDQGRLLPGLARRWTCDASRLRWTFELRPGARFHDGTAVDAAQVVRVLERAHQRPGLLRLAPLRSLRAAGGAVVFELAEPFALLPALLTHSSTMLLAASSFDAGGVRAIVGSGPYRVHEMAAPQRVEVQALAPGLRVQRAAFLSVARAETRALMAEAGEADLAFALDPASLQRLRREPRVAVLQVTVPRTLIVKLDSGHRWLRDRRARQALSLAFNRGGIARGLLRDGELAASQLLPPTLADWHLPGLAPLAFDPAAARRLWAELGWRPGADGILERGGERLALTLRTFPDRPELPLVAAALQEQLRQTGIDCRVAIGNSGEVPLRHRDGSLEMALAPRQYGLTADPLGTLMQDFAAGGGDWGAMNWHSPALEAAMTALTRGEGDAAAGRRRVVTVLHEELPVIPVAWYRQTAAAARPLAGIALDPLERSWRLADMPWAGGGA